MPLHRQINCHKIYEGNLFKKGEVNTAWQARYFVVYDDRTIDYFKTKKQSTQRNKAKGTIYLTQIKRVELVQYKNTNDCAADKSWLSASRSPNAIASFMFKDSLSTPSNYTLSVTEYTKENGTPCPDDVHDIENQSQRSNTYTECGVNGWSTSHVDNVVVSSVGPPPEYSEEVLHQTEKQFEKQREIMNKSLEELKQNKMTQYPKRSLTPMLGIGIDQSSVSPASSAAACQLTDDDGFSFPSLSLDVKGSVSSSSNYFSRSISNRKSSQHLSVASSKSNESDAFQIILRGTKLGLQCDKQYAFALIDAQRGREWLLSAENNTELKRWITLCHELSQGYLVLDGRLNNKYFVLYENKILNCYADHNLKNIERDYDLRHILFLKYNPTIENATKIEIGFNSNTLTLNAPSSLMANEWQHRIKSLFAQKLLLRIVYDSKVESVHIIHSGQQLKNRHIALYRDYIVIFQSTNQFEAMKHMTFFTKTIFDSYARKEKCIVIPINANIKIRAASHKHGNHAFMVANAAGDRKWYISVRKKELLAQWLAQLCPTKYKCPRDRKIRKSKSRHKNETGRYIDVAIESSFSPKPPPIKSEKTEYVTLRIERKNIDGTVSEQVVKVPTPVLDDFPSNKSNKCIKTNINGIVGSSDSADYDQIDESY